MQKIEKTNAKGITLIALVVTIVILLILAGITINALTDNGLISKTKQAKKENEESIFNENISLLTTAYKMDLLTNKENAKKNLEDSIDAYGYNYEYVESDTIVVVSYLQYKANIDIETGTVDSSKQYISLDKDKVNLYLNDSSKKEYKVTYQSNIYVGLKWESTDENVVTVDQNGLIKAINLGECKVAVSTDDNEISKEIIVKVSNLVEGITLNKENVTLIKGNNSSVNVLSQTLTASITNSNATDKTIKWTSSDNNIATVNENGVVTAVSAGSCTIAANANDESEQSASATITVKERKYMYYYGNTFSSLTGGWEAYDPGGATYKSSLFSLQSNYISVSYDNSYWWCCAGRTKTGISTEDYNILYMKVKAYLHTESWQGNTVQYGFSNIGSESNINGTKEKTWDISQKHNTSGRPYLINACYHTAEPYTGYDRNSYIYLYETYLEK